ncbi:MAG: hypothetical protein AAGK32_08695 [Actinomycetota bacterium]
MVSFFFPLLVMLAMVAPIPWLMQRRPPDTPTTWGEAMFGALWVTCILFLAFGVIPHQWIVWADSDLGWRSDRFLVGPGEILADLPFDIPYTALRDIMVVNIHVVFAVGMVWLWAKWQNRGQEPAGDDTISSDYGRPLVGDKA